MNPIGIRSITHTFTSFETEFLKTMSPFRVEIYDKKHWSPAITLGIMYIYFVNFFREYIEHSNIPPYMVEPSSSKDYITII